MLIPRRAVPALSLPTVTGSTWTLGASPPAHFTLIVFYRGLHCPVCRAYLSELNRLHADFTARGVAVFVASSSLPIDEARRWGLYVSTSRGKTSLGIEEPARFSEPGVFLVRADGTLYWASVQTMPFARPHFAEMLTAIDFVLKNDYPARGEA